ncbi:MAG: DUF4861 family protein [Mucinivorans sp.]
MKTLEKIIFSLLVLALLPLVANAKSDQITVKVSNPTRIARQAQTIEIPWQEIISRLPQACPQNIVVSIEGEQIPSQVSAQALLFQARVEGKASVCYTINIGEREEYPRLTFARAVPERLDDWAWENDKMAYRMYGPALEATGEVSSGIDVWCKKTDRLVLDRWYAQNDYHNDHGQGMDGYKVGRTLGAGAMAIVESDTLAMSRNYIKASLIESGPIRTTFSLSYAPYKVGRQTITEQRTVSIDAHSHFNRITVRYPTLDGNATAVAGVPLRPSTIWEATPQAIITSEDADKKHGNIFLAVVMQSISKNMTLQNHAVLQTTIQEQQPLTYYIGAAWSLAGVTFDEWKKMVEHQTICINHPLRVTIK